MKATGFDGILLSHPPRKQVEAPGYMGLSPHACRGGCFVFPHESYLIFHTLVLIQTKRRFTRASADELFIVGINEKSCRQTPKATRVDILITIGLWHNLKYIV